MRLADLRAWHVLHAICGACGHVSEVPVVRLMRGGAPDTAIRSLNEKLRCRRCRWKGVGNFLTIGFRAR
jgi:ribosomal protein L37E